MFTFFLQLMNFCIDDSSIEYMVFWLDVEHFKYFDGASDDINLFAHHISELLTYNLNGLLT